MNPHKQPPDAQPGSTAVTEHYRKIGALGGRAKSPAKTRAARAAARKRWGLPDPEARAIAPSRLRDQRWYVGQGRNGNIAMWDTEQKCFWITTVSDLPDPSNYPSGSARVVRLKQEGHISHEGGTFKPLQRLDEKPKASGV